MQKFHKKIHIFFILIINFFCISLCTKSNKYDYIEEDSTINNIISLSLDNADSKLEKYVNVNYFVSLKTETSILVNEIKKISDYYNDEEYVNIDTEQYNALANSVLSIFSSLNTDEYEAFKDLAKEDKDIQSMIDIIESDFSKSNETVSENIMIDNIIELSTGAMSIANLLYANNVCTAAIVAIKGAYNSMLAVLKAFFIPNSVKIGIVTASVLVISTVVIVNWNKIKPIFNQIKNIFISNAQQLSSCVNIVLNSISKTANESEENNENVQNDIDNILSNATKGRETAGKTDQYLKKSGFDKANKDFDSLDPKDVKDISTDYGNGKTGVLKDGSKVNVRPGSSYGEPTLEIQRPNGRRIKIRYGE